MKDIVLSGARRCPKTRYYEVVLQERGLDYELADVERDAAAAAWLTALTGSPDKFPTFAIKGRKLRNPLPAELDKHLARAGLYDPGLVHDEGSKRFIRHMAPADAFVSYQWHGNRMVLSHIEVEHSLRGSGIGAALAREVFTALEQQPHEIRLTCPFLRREALRRPEWRLRFDLPADGTARDT